MKFIRPIVIGKTGLEMDIHIKQKYAKALRNMEKTVYRMTTK